MNSVLAWLVRQVKSPTTHVAIAAFVSALMKAGIIPPSYAIVVVAIFAVLGITIPEAGEKTPPSNPGGQP